jgi:hypothetical protein
MDILKLLNIQFTAKPCRFFYLDFITQIISGEKYKLLQASKYFPTTPSPNVINANSSLHLRGHTYKTRDKGFIPYIFKQQRGRQNIVNRLVTSIPKIKSARDFFVC